MRFKTYDALRTFVVAADRLSLTAAARELNVSKGAVSYQIRRLEEALGFAVFTRRRGGVDLTENGQALWQASRTAFHDLEQTIAGLGRQDTRRITIGLSTYFASRWLSPRLMTFINRHPRVGLRLQPMIDPADYRAENIDMAIRWGKGDWKASRTEWLFRCPALPTAGVEIAQRAARVGLAEVLAEKALLHDREGSQAWSDWHRAAGLRYRPSRDDLVIPDPNVRVQAVIDGQGVALNDALVDDEFSAGRLVVISTVELTDYGYHLVYTQDALDNPALQAFRNWIKTEADAYAEA